MPSKQRVLCGGFGSRYSVGKIEKSDLSFELYRRCSGRSKEFKPFVLLSDDPTLWGGRLLLLLLLLLI